MNNLRIILVAITLIQSCVAGGRIGDDLDGWKVLYGAPVRSVEIFGMTDYVFTPKSFPGLTIQVTFIRGHAAKAIFTTKNRLVTQNGLDHLLSHHSTAMWAERVGPSGVTYYETEDGKRTLHVEQDGDDGRAVVTSVEYRIALQAQKKAQQGVTPNR